MSFCSSVNLRRKRHKPETSARGPPSRRNIMRKIMLAQGVVETNVGIARPTSEKVFQLPNPPAIKPIMEDPFSSGPSSIQRDVRGNRDRSST